MADIAFVLGNGESRKGISIGDLKQHGRVYACNGVYRTDRPDWLVAVDPKMMLEIAETDYMEKNKVYSNYNAHQYATSKSTVQSSTTYSKTPETTKKARMTPLFTAIG